MNIVIIGNSTAAIACVEAIRKHDKKSNITLVSGESYHAYGRPLISYLLEGKIAEEQMAYRDQNFYLENHCKILLGTNVTSIDAKAQQIILERGDVLSYDRLLVATGSSPVVPPIPGLNEVQNRFTFTTLADAKALQDAVSFNSRVLVLGAGLIGLKCAEGLSAHTKHITVVDLANQCLPNSLPAQAACRVQEHIMAQSIHLVLEEGVKQFTKNTAILSKGREIPFDLLIIAVGVRPNTDLVVKAGGKVDRGILTDIHGQTNLPNVYAAGDCTESIDMCTGEQKIQAILPNAYMQGEYAGLHMVKENANVPTLMPMNAVSLWGLHMVSAGHYQGECLEYDDGVNLRLLFVKEGLLSGFFMMGDVSRAGIYTALIREKRPLDTVDFELLKFHPALAAFPRVERKRKLGSESA